MSTTADHTPSASPEVEQPVVRNRGLRYAFVGVVLMIVAIPQMFVAASTASTGHFVLAGIGIALIVAGTVTAIVRPRGAAGGSR